MINYDISEELFTKLYYRACVGKQLTWDYITSILQEHNARMINDDIGTVAVFATEQDLTLFLLKYN